MKYFKRILLVAGVLLLAFAGWLALTPMPDGVPVLEYHMVNDADNGEGWAYNVPPEEFRQQLDYLQQQGYTTITMLEFMKAKKGKLELEYYGVDDLNDLIDALRAMQRRG